MLFGNAGYLYASLTLFIDSLQVWIHHCADISTFFVCSRMIYEGKKFQILAFG